MKKPFLVLLVLCCMSIAIVGCKPELKNVRGQVKSIEFSADSTMAPKSMILSVDGQDKTVVLVDARFQNGIAIQGDSVILDYIDGKENALRGLVVTVLPKPAQVFVPTDTVVTAEITQPADSVK